MLNDPTAMYVGVCVGAVSMHHAVPSTLFSKLSGDLHSHKEKLVYLSAKARSFSYAGYPQKDAAWAHGSSSEGKPEEDQWAELKAELRRLGVNVPSSYKDLYHLNYAIGWCSWVPRPGDPEGSPLSWSLPNESEHVSVKARATATPSPGISYMIPPGDYPTTQSG